MSLYSLNSPILSKLKSTGLKIGGHGFLVDSLALMDKGTKEKRMIWKGRAKIDSAEGLALGLNSVLFSTAKKNDRLLMYVSDIQNTDGVWDKKRPFPVYHAYSFLSSVFSEVMLMPQRTMYTPKGMVSYMWNNKKGEKIYIFWVDANEAKELNLKKIGLKGRVYNNYGDEMNTERLVVSRSPIFVIE